MTSVRQRIQCWWFQISSWRHFVFWPIKAGTLQPLPQLGWFVSIWIPSSFTFDSYVDGLVDGHLGLDQDAAQVGALVGALLHVRQPQGAVLEHHLTVIIGQLHAVLQPLDGIIRVANHAARYVGVPARHCGDVPHGSDSRWTWRHREERGGWRGEGDRERETQRVGERADEARKVMAE